MAGITAATPGIDEAVTTGISIEGESSLMKIAAAYTGLISVIGLLLNILVIAVIVILKDYKDTKQWYVLNLAAANGLNLLMLLVSLQQGVTGSWSTGLPACVAFQGAFFASYFAGILLLVVMSFDLYFDIAHPSSNSCKKVRSIPVSLIWAGMVWCIATVAAVPIMMNSIVIGNFCDFSFDSIHPECEAAGIHSEAPCETFIMYQEFSSFEDKPANDLAKFDSDNSYVMNSSEFSGDYTPYYDYEDYIYEPLDNDIEEPKKESQSDCFPDITEGYSTWIVINFVLTFAVPFALMACCYCGILYRLRNPSVRASLQSSKTRSDNNSSGKNSQGDGSVREILLVVSLFATFVICWCPLHGVSLSRIRGITLNIDICYKLRSAVVLLANSNSSVNPILCILLGIDFRTKLKRLVSKLCGESRASKRNGSHKEDVTDSTKEIPIKPEVPLATIWKADADNDIVDVEAQAEVTSNIDQN